MSKVSYPGFINKPTLFRIQVSLLHFFESFLGQRPQRARLKRRKRDWSHVKACVPEGSILFLLLSLIFINDLSNTLTSTGKVLQITLPSSQQLQTVILQHKG